MDASKKAWLQKADSAIDEALTLLNTGGTFTQLSLGTRTILGRRVKFSLIAETTLPPKATQSQNQLMSITPPVPPATHNITKPRPRGGQRLVKNE